MAEYVTLKKPDGTVIYPQTSYESIMEFARPYGIGDSFSATGTTFMYGYVSNSASTIYTELVLPKTISTDVTTVSVSGKITSRGIAGYLLNAAVIGTDIVINAANIVSGRNAIELLIKKANSTAFSVTNNTPVISQCDITITFS